MLALAAGHARRGHEVHVLAILDVGAAPALLAELAAEGVTVHAVEVPARSYRFERAECRRIMAEVRPDVVHLHGYRPDVVDAPAARSLGIPVVTTVHGFTGGGWRNRLYETLQVRAFRRFGAVVAVSKPLRELLLRRGVPAPVLRTVVNGWSPARPAVSRAEARAALGIADDAPRAGWVGRLTAEKGADVFLEALARTTLSASIVGDGRERAALEARAESLGIAPRARFHGMVADAGRLVRAFDLLVISSRTEGTPVVLFEAMAAGVPVVSTAVGGIPDVVSGAEASLVPSEDPAALAQAMTGVTRDPGAAARRAAAAERVLAERFAAGPWLEAYEQVYREAGAGRRRETA